MNDGLLLRTGDDEFIAYYLSPYLNYIVESGKYDVKDEDLSGKVFLFQIACPNSIQVLETAMNQNLRDLPFFKHRRIQINTPQASQSKIDLRILRAGVAGTLAYVVHGNIEDAHHVYNLLMKAGETFGIERLGLKVYGTNHTENGFYQMFIHFIPAWPQDKDFHVLSWR